MRNCFDCSSPGNFIVQMLSPWRPFSQKTGVCSKVSVAPVPTMKLLVLQLRVPRSKWQNTTISFPTKGIAYPNKMEYLHRKSGGIWPLLPFADQNSAALQMDTTKTSKLTSLFTFSIFLLSLALCNTRDILYGFVLFQSLHGAAFATPLQFLAFHSARLMPRCFRSLQSHHTKVYLTLIELEHSENMSFPIFQMQEQV